GTSQRRSAAAVPRSGSAPAVLAAHPCHASSLEQGHPRLSRCTRFSRNRDTPVGTKHSGRGPRLSGPEPYLSWAVVRVAAVAAALQATPDGCRVRQVFSDRSLSPRRGSARRSPTGIHTARLGNVVRGKGRYASGY